MDLSILKTLDLETIADPAMRQCVQALLNLIEALLAENQSLRATVQAQRDEMARLTGEQGKPTVKPNRPPRPPRDHSSEPERRLPRHERRKTSKLDQLVIDRTDILPVDPASLPPDAVFRGYEDVVVQDLVLRHETVCFRKAVWSSAATHQRVRAPLPPGYAGAFGPGIKRLALELYHGANVSEAKLLAFFREAGVVISAGTVAAWVSDGAGLFGEEAAAVYRAGLESSPWQHLDDTETRVNGQRQHCQVVCNPLYTAYHTTPKKDRLTVIDVLRGATERVFRWTAEAETLLESWGLSAASWRWVRGLPRDRVLSAEQLRALLDAEREWMGTQQRDRITEALAIGAYRAERDWPVVKLLLGDDAAQWRGVTEAQALCWVHEGRHYKKLTPYVAEHQRVLEAFRKQFWEYYRELLAYQQGPSAAERERLEAAFDTLFATETGYGLLDKRIAKTRAKKTGLLQVLGHPEVPLHNNPAELGARQRVRKRDVSFGPRSPAGCQAWDTFMTLSATTKKLGISFSAFLNDRLRGLGQIPRLDELIRHRAATLRLGASWAPA